MGRNSSCVVLTVYFEDPFYVGVFERKSQGRMQAAKVTFGAEPRDAEVYALILERFCTLPFSAPVYAQEREVSRLNPKRSQRLAARELQVPVASTRAQRALQLEREAQAQLRQHQTARARAALKEARFEQKQARRKEKRKGH